MFKIVTAIAVALSLAAGGTALAGADLGFDLTGIRLAPDALRLETRTQQGTQDQACDSALNPDCEPLQDQLREQDRLRDQTCVPGEADCEPTQEQLRSQERIHLSENDAPYGNANQGESSAGAGAGNGNGNGQP